MPSRKRLNECNVLVVEDEYAIAWQLKADLEAAGVRVLGPVASIAEAVATIRGTPGIDGAVLDLNLNGKVTYEVADLLLELGIPFLFATGYDEDTIPARYRGIPYSAKPVTAAYVARILDCEEAA